MTRRTITTASGQIEAEPYGPHTDLRVGRTVKRPRCVRFGRIRPWRWHVTTFELVEGNYPGVFDRWHHVGAESGWAMTRWGAQFAGARRTTVR